MKSERCFSKCLWFIKVAFLLVVGLSCRTGNANACAPSSCGNIHNISFPFRLKDDPKHCGDSRFTLYCENNVTVLHLIPGKYYVQQIDYRTTSDGEYQSGEIRVVDPGIQKNNCSSIPRYPIAYHNFRTREDYLAYYDVDLSTNMPVSFLKCLNPVNSSLYVETSPCINISPGTSLSQSKSYGYVKIGDTNSSELEIGCSIEWSTFISSSLYQEHQNASYEYTHNALLYGFEINWHYQTPFCRSGWNRFSNCLPYTISGFFRYLERRFDEYRVLISVIFVVFFLVRFILGVGLIIHKWRRRHLSVYSTIEDFLQSDNKFIPIRYSFSNIKKMTGGFKDKLGEGGFGSVFKGKLRSGRFGAIKLLSNPKANGQDFMNEVATIGRIHHVNVVQLVGYCVEGSKRALVYEFMPNGSLDKYIHSKEGSIPLSCKKMFEISIGVAQGIEYLHGGCDMQILHFDIKPHNILLDENFIPKISDFGLAKLYKIDDSIVSLTAVRGTMGYIAPEFFYKTIGGVSYKADVYSFGMLLMEMASRRKNLNATVDHSSQIYFPSWAYDQYKEGNDLGMDDVLEDEKPMIQKMVITALWCIQMKPSDRPSMKAVIEMLEGSVESLQMPPKPFLCPDLEMPIVNHDSIPNGLNPTCSVTKLTISTLSAGR